MALRQPIFHAVPTTLRQPICFQCRSLHKRAVKPIPPPRPFVPDAQTFLTLIGRKMSQHAAKIPSWEALFTLSSEQLRESGVEPARARRYLLWWRDRYRNGIVGVGGDLKKVTNGVAELRIVQVSSPEYKTPATLTRDAGVRQMIINTPLGIAAPEDPANPKTPLPAELGIVPVETLPLRSGEKQKVDGLKIINGTISGKGIELIKGHPSVARLRVQDGLWENRRGHKVDGGERRKAEVRAKRRAAERNTR